VVAYLISQTPGRGERWAEFEKTIPLIRKEALVQRETKDKEEEKWI
jgi:hypothetical protein